MVLLALLITALVIFGLWLYTAFIAASFPSLTGKKILLLIAHPDDEAMFFAPTITALTCPELGNHIKIICLSTGTAGGVGEVRRKELFKSGELLGLQEKNDILIVDDPYASFPPRPALSEEDTDADTLTSPPPSALQDSPAAKWSPALISDLLLRTFAPTLPRTPSSKAPTALIDVILTFDAYGVSSHPNHIACHAAALAFLKTLMQGRTGWESPVHVYTLTTIPIWRKYAGVLDCLMTVLALMWAMWLGRMGRGGKEKRLQGPGLLLCVSGLSAWVRGLRAMVQGHRSQMLWFRWGWISLGRYMVLNDLRRVKGY